MDESAQRDKRLQELEQVDKDIIQLISLAGQCLQELSKEKPVSKTAEGHCTNFLKTLEGIDRTLAQQVSHLQQISTGVTHEGTHYDCSKEREIMLRCEGDLDEILQYLVQQKEQYLASTLPDPAAMESDEVVFDETTTVRTPQTM
ncbi:mediator of RNA polymerase II transcription subunit 11-like [Paramacrobiotus metropolitanus]|uniref:mediator of RNA polymerase II transcription subunit 11-like n=1 Tax=Paramacrobiotus metropolitanus TaxID=2943436 RepID=UPI0024462F38|nr:mediator of RNA polymerase II transcription subunit 11-like [Paramacrobiotus metropolitanus]XP_055340861.1 mediator of RNA polymerase II transcription subunit 11-like [Paramacrobiotus metropolitanus]